MQLLEARAYLASFARHRLQKNRRALISSHNIIQSLAYKLDSLLAALAHMTSRMEVVVIAWQILHPLKIIRHRHKCKIPCLSRIRARIQSVRRMSNQSPEASIRQDYLQSLYIRRIDSLRSSTSRIPREECKSICSNAYSIPTHCLKSAACRKMTSDIQFFLVQYLTPPLIIPNHYLSVFYHTKQAYSVSNKKKHQPSG